MAFLETGIFCSGEEYARGVPNRIHEGQLREEDIYTLCLHLESEKRQATKMAVRTLKIVQKTGFAVIKFAFLDPDLNSRIKTTETIADGLINKLQGACMVDTTTQEKFVVDQAYFKDYFEDQFGSILAKGNEVSLLQ